LDVTDHFVGIQTDLSGGDVDVYLPSVANGARGKEYVITDIGDNANVNNINIWVQPGESLNGVVAAGPNYVMNVPGETVRLFAYSPTGWWII
jgi:hypothetical protein